MQTIHQIYIDGAFVTPHGTETIEIINPTTGKLLARATLADADDTRRAIAAARKALPAFAQTTVADRVAMLKRMQDVLGDWHDWLMRRLKNMARQLRGRHGYRTSQRNRFSMPRLRWKPTASPASWVRRPS